MLPRLLLVALPLATGCARMFPEKVADGVAQLTVRDVAGVLLVVNDDEDCGFASSDVVGSPAVSGALGETGTATWTVTDCTIDLGPEPVEISRDCNDVGTYASGAFTITARQVVTGRITGDPDTPVIPETPDAATFLLDDVRFADFVVTKDGSEDSLRVLEGGLEVSITPMLAVDAESGACSVVTPHISFDDITWSPSTVEVTSGKRVFQVPIADGVLSATNGTVGEHENRVEGLLTVWRKPVQVALSGPEDGLDPDYDPQVLEDSYTCNEDLAQPVGFSCDLDPILAENAARLIVKNFGLITKTVDLDEDCGFGNLMEQVTALLDPVTLESLLTGGEQTFEFDAQSCQVGGDMHLIYSDCVGTDYYLDGTATVTGAKIVTGKVVLDDDPLQPQNPRGAVVEIPYVALDEATPLERPPGSETFEPWLELHDGTLSGTALPVAGEAADAPGAYFIVIPVGEFEDVRLRNSDVTLRNGAMSFPMHVDDSSLFAFNGAYQGEANWLYGTVTLDGTTWEIGSAEAPLPLVPDYDQAAFDETYECTDNLAGVVPVQ